ncbi:hypothetical protein [Bradyrhizobium sp. CSS354]|uniref:hypothetical protein n=1 Tax=Bradyrhizobium sp. CSS354 TaxID=2699172 RepID=UPI0023AF52CB|nr:hypothetical protein [Bradyrhizobium sp. CSS354]
MSIKSTTIAARVELLSDRIRRLAIRSHIEEQYEEVLRAYAKRSTPFAISAIFLRTQLMIKRHFR